MTKARRMPYNDLPRLETGVGVANARNPLQCAAAVKILKGHTPVCKVGKHPTGFHPISAGGNCE